MICRSDLTVVFASNLRLNSLRNVYIMSSYIYRDLKEISEYDKKSCPYVLIDLTTNIIFMNSNNAEINIK